MVLNRIGVSKIITNKKRLCLGLGIFLISSFFTALFALDVPTLKGRVNDYANIINSDCEKELNEYLTSLDQQTGVQLVVLTVPSLEGDDLANFAIKVAEKWGIGHSGKDNGALLLVAYEERSIRIEVGYGLEESLTDAKCGLIIRNVIIPEFKTGDYSEGILKGIKNMGGIASGNVELVEKNVLEEDDSSEDSLVGLVFMIIWLIFFFLVISSRGGIWKWFFLSRMFGGRRHGPPPRNPPRNPSSSFGNSRSNSGFGGFGGGSSFHGGGGHFGGGGASGHW